MFCLFGVLEDVLSSGVLDFFLGGGFVAEFDTWVLVFALSLGGLMRNLRCFDKVCYSNLYSLYIGFLVYIGGAFGNQLIAGIGFLLGD